MNRFLFIGGDKRSIYAAQRVSMTYETAALGLSCGLSQPSGKYDKIVLPLPFSRDGSHINSPYCEYPLPLSVITDYADEGATVLSGQVSPVLSELCENSRLTLTDYFANEQLTLKNALLTAEAAVSLIINETEFSLLDSAALITGYGRIAAYTAELLKSFRCRVTIAARDPVQRERAILDGHCALPLSLVSLAAGGSDIIINTAPTAPGEIFTPEVFEGMRRTALFVELASKPSEPEKSYAAKYGIHYTAASGLPGKYSPKTAGEAIAETILSMIS